MIIIILKDKKIKVWELGKKEAIKNDLAFLYLKIGGRISILNNH